MSQPTILVRVRVVYGNTVLDPANANALLLARIAGTKTLTSEALACAQAMGANVEVVCDSGGSAVEHFIRERAASLAASADCQRRSA